MKRASVGMGVAAAIGFLLVSAHFRCCQGEDGFAQNASIGGLVAAGLFVAAIFAQPAWRFRPVASAATTAALFLLVGSIVLLARPPWDDYSFGRPLHLGWRAASVFAAATVATYLLSVATARWTGPRRHA